ncbi:NAD-dependent epimerase/dehydratase family protein [Yoonia sp. I 8.24]|uniref:NAD-dependent epimerase/dehydratase family protein n=1 Tax=Yoonia sp. I 8.24 TaxID=1537229 RepID=UPI001F9FE351|nr:SDR family oxidoreductase [Yoonia sp. I 8.24]
MTILVTGAHGYVGAVVLGRLVALGHNVKTADAGWFDHARVAPITRSAADWDDFRTPTVQDLRGVDAVIHLAGYSNDPMGWLNPQETYDLNEKAAIALAQLAKQAGVGRFVFSSTCSVYGESGAIELDETGPTKPITPYAAAKLGAEKALLSLNDAGFEVAILRGATAFGASPVPRTDLLLNELCAEAACGRPIRLLSDGKSWRPFMPVQDFARALVTAAVQRPVGNTKPPIWNIAPPNMQMTVQEAATRAAIAGQAAPPLLGENGQADRRSYRVNGTAFLRAFPSFSYSDDFESHVAQTIDVFRQIPTLDADLRADRFVRLARFKQAGAA